MQRLNRYGVFAEGWCYSKVYEEEEEEEEEMKKASSPNMQINQAKPAICLLRPNPQSTIHNPQSTIHRIIQSTDDNKM